MISMSALAEQHGSDALHRRSLSRMIPRNHELGVGVGGNTRIRPVLGAHASFHGIAVSSWVAYHRFTFPGENRLSTWKNLV